MGRRGSLVLLPVTLLVAACDGREDAPAVPGRSRFVEQALARPPPDLATLPDRARRGAEGAFEDLIRLRESGGPETVPALIEILDAHRGSGRIHGFAAAQALFHLGGDKAQAALENALAADEYPWQSALDYTFHWDMDAGERDRFLGHCVLRSSNTTLRAKIAADRAQARRGEDVTLTFSVTNAAAQPVAVLTVDGRLEADLVLRDADGRFAWVRPVAQFGADTVPRLGWQQLTPGQTAEFEFVRAFLPCERGKGRYQSHGIVREFNVETGSGRGGKFDVVGVFSRQSARAAPEPPAPPWIGRVVCDPIGLTIAD